LICLDLRVVMGNQLCCSALSLVRPENSFFGERTSLMRLLKLILVAAFATFVAMPAWALTDRQVRETVEDELDEALGKDNRPGGAAVVVRIDGRTLFFNFGTAARGKVITSDSLFNLASLGKTFDATLLAMAVLQGELALDDTVGKYVPELQGVGDVSNIRLDHLVSYTSGLSLPQDLPPWPDVFYDLPKFMQYLKAWKIPGDHEVGKTHVYSHAAFMLLHIVFERRYGMSYAELLKEKLLEPLGLSSTSLPPHRNAVALLPPELMRRVVQNHDENGRRVGKPGNVQSFYHWDGTGQMFSSARDMGTFLAAQLGEVTDPTVLPEAVALAQKPVAASPPNFLQALAWEVRQGALTMVDKNGALDNTSSYIGVVPDRRIGLVIMTNRGDQYVAKVGRRTLLRLGLPKDVALKELEALERRDE
jgi:beta-lactamase class C